MLSLLKYERKSRLRSQCDTETSGTEVFCRILDRILPSSTLPQPMKHTNVHKTESSPSQYFHSLPFLVFYYQWVSSFQCFG